MSNSANDRNRALPEWFLLSDPGIGGLDFNGLALRLLRRLDAEYPERVDLSICDRLKERLSEFKEVWTWLETQKIVSGPLSNCSLTLSGMRAFRKAVEQASELTRAQLHSKADMDAEIANQLLLDILRSHFHDYIERTEGR